MTYFIIYIVGVVVWANIMEMYRKKESLQHQQERDDPHHSYETCICYERSYWWSGQGFDYPKWFDPFLWPFGVLFFTITHLWSILVWITLFPSEILSCLSQTKYRYSSCSPNRAQREKDIDTILAEVREFVEE